MKDLKLNTAPGPEPEPPKPEPVVFLEETKFDGENGNDYSIAVDEKNGVIVYSECCADVMTPETAAPLARTQMRVLAIDPGLKSGVCLFDGDAEVIRVSLIIPNGLKGLQDFWEAHVRYLDYDVLVVESFELEEGSHGIDYESPLAIIHWLESLNIRIVWQRRMQRGKDKLLTDAVLKRAGLYPPRGQVKEKHQIEALRHALSFLVRQRHLPTISLLHPKEEP
jgi:hypothetical protein